MFSFNWFSNMAGYSGNIQADMIEEERENGCPVTDKYLCSECGFLVSEKLWVDKNNCCIDCIKERENESI